MCRRTWTTPSGVGDRRRGKRNVAANSYALGNAEPSRTEERKKSNGDIEHHVWQSDGYVTMVKVR
jgi:hypothetical protein